jgi:hypothetical protein
MFPLYTARTRISAAAILHLALHMPRMHKKPPRDLSEYYNIVRSETQTLRVESQSAGHPFR